MKKFHYDFKNKKNSKRYLFILIFVIIIFSIFSLHNSIFFSDTETSQNVTADLSDNIFNQLNDLDFADVDKILNELKNDANIFGTSNFREKIEDIINGNYFVDSGSFIEFVITKIINNILKYLPLIFTILAISILTRFVSTLKNKDNEGVDNVVNFVTYGVIITMLTFIFKNVITLSGDTLNSIKNQIDIILPIMLTLLTAVGGISSVGIYKPLIMVLSGGIVTLFSNFIYPLFILSFILIIVGNLTDSIKLNKFIELIFSVFKWSIGFIFTIFSAFLTFQGITAGKYDGISVSATKFAIKSYIPIIGGYLSDGLDFIVLSSVLIKNAIGVAGLVIVVLTVITPIIEIVLLKFSLQFLSAILETIGDNKTSNFINQCSKILLIPIVILIAVSFMYLLVMSLIMVTANVV